MPSVGERLVRRLLWFDISRGFDSLAGTALRDSLQCALANTAFANRIWLFLPTDHEESLGELRDALASQRGICLDDPRIELHTRLTHGVYARLRILPPEVDELLFIRAGVLVPPGWDTRLRQLSNRNARIACISPLTTGLPPFIRSLSTPALSAEDWQRQDARLATFKTVPPLETSAVLPVCFLLRPRLLRENLPVPKPAPESAPENLSARIEAAGLINLISTNLLIAGPDQAAIDDEVKHYLQLIAEDTETLAGLRQYLKREGAKRQRKKRTQRPSPKPVQLHLTHSWGGGLGNWVDDFAAGDKERSNLVLKSIGNWGAFGQRLELYTRYSDPEPFRVWTLDKPIRHTATTRLDYQEILTEIITVYGVEGLLISSFIGHSLDCLRTELPTLIVAHDHYPFCVVLYAYFNETCSHCDQQRLERCLAENPGHRYFKTVTAQQWEALRRAFITAALRGPVSLVAPTASTAERWLSQMPELAALPVHIVPHGLQLPDSPPLAGTDSERLRLVLLGSLSWAKGLELFEDSIPEISQFADIHLLGCGADGKRFANLTGVTVKSYYPREDLAAELAAIRPHLGLLGSLVPETFSYTLSELTHFGIPALATRNGSFVDRIEHDRTGFLVEANSKAIIDAVRKIDQDRERLAHVRSEIARAYHARLEGMVASYHKLLPMTASSIDTDQIQALPEKPKRARMVHVNPNATFGMAAVDFLRYAAAKFYHSPQIPFWIRWLAALPFPGIRQQMSRAKFEE